MTAPRDRIDDVLAAWHRELPEAVMPSSELTKRVLQLAQQLKTVMSRAIASFGLTPAEYDIVAALRRSGPPYRLKPSTLARELLLSTGGTTKALHALADRDLVRRNSDPADARSTWVELTPTGVELAGQAVVASTRAQHRMFLGCDAATLKSAAGAVRGVLEEARDADS